MSSDRQTPGFASAAPELAPRLAALELLEAALSRRTGFDEAAGAPAFLALPLRDRAFARALALGTLRRLGGLDARLAPRLRAPPPERVRNLLRLGAAQVLHMEVPAFAAVATTVEAGRALRVPRPLQGLINAVLRGLAAEGPGEAAPEAYAPPWLLARWRAAYGEARALAIARAIPLEPGTDLTPRPDADVADLARALEAEVLPGGSLRTGRRGDVGDWPGFASGELWVQDAAAAVPARLLGDGGGRAALDLCAAPGGKTLQLAAAGWSATAVDRSRARLTRLEANLARTGLSAALVCADALELGDLPAADAVLLDAPCTATGTFRRHPEVLWATRPSDVAALAAAQSRLLDAAADRVRPQGRLVYCVCSLEPEEGEAQVRAFLGRRADFRADPPAAGEAGLAAGEITGEGFVRLLPDGARPGGGQDGFFAARLRRA